MRNEKKNEVGCEMADILSRLPPFLNAGIRDKNNSAGPCFDQLITDGMRDSFQIDRGTWDEITGYGR